jgi:zinc/manganese transport system permease protein
VLEILAAPFAACLVLAGIHCYLGIHVVMRGVIFVDLALAQIAAMGVAVAAAMGYEPHSAMGYAFALGFASLGAGVFAVGRFHDARVPQEAVIGIVYAVSSALAILLFSKVPIGKEEIDHMLVGRLLYVDWAEVGVTAGLYAAIGVLHVCLRKRFFAISANADREAAAGVPVRLWDFVFYLSFGAVVTSSVQIAGVLLVFSFLIVPAVCAMMFFRGVGPRLLAGWAFGLAASVIGLTMSAQWDLPTGASVVATFGGLFLGCAAVYGLTVRRRRLRGGGVSPG